MKQKWMRFDDSGVGGSKQVMNECTFLKSHSFSNKYSCLDLKATHEVLLVLYVVNQGY